MVLEIVDIIFKLSAPGHKFLFFKVDNLDVQSFKIFQINECYILKVSWSGIVPFKDLRGLFLYTESASPPV